MTLTPSDIEQKTFSTALRGYNLDEVDDFLDEIVRSMRKLHEELEEARAARVEMPPVEMPPAELEPLEEVEIPPVAVPVVEPTPLPPIDESAVGKALIAAQETAERIVTDARSEADDILVRARSDAETFEETRLKRKADAEQEITRIDLLVGRVKSELAGLSTAVGADLDDMTRTIDAAIAELDEAAADIDREAADEERDAEASSDDVANDVAVEALDDENLIASDEPDLPPGLSEIAADPLDESGDEDSSEDVDVAENDGGSGENSESNSDDDSEDEYFNFPDGDDDDGDDGDDGDDDDDEERTD